MKRIVALIVLFSLLTTAGETLRWRGSYDDARREAVENRSLLLLLLVNSDCAPCRELVRKITALHRSDPALFRNLVPVIVTTDHRASYPIELYYSRQFPTLFLVDPVRELPVAGPCPGAGCDSFLKEKLNPGEEGQAWAR